MPSINVARTDTFEQQRVKINEIGSQVFSITQGGSDLATGNLKLGDGTRQLPSLSFTTNNTLGIYKSDTNKFGFVGGSKKIFDLDISGVTSYKNFAIQQNILYDAGISILNNGSNYDSGSFTDIALSGGSGDGASLDIEVVEYTGTITSFGENYNPGSFTGVLLTGGSGTGAEVSFSVDGIDAGDIVGGSGYIPALYSNVALIGGSGTGAAADISVVGTTDPIGSITNPGSGYSDHADITLSVLNVPTQTFVLTTVTNPGSPPPDNVYQVDGSTQATIVLNPGNTYRFDTSDASLIGHPIVFDDGSFQGLPSSDFFVIQKGTYGSAGSFIEMIVKPTATIGNSYSYDCLVHPGMGGTISVVSGSTSTYGNGYQAVVNTSGGVVTGFDFIAAASLNDYKNGDQVTFYTPDLGQGATGSGFVYTISSITYAGSVISVQIVSTGQDYVNGDVLSANTSDLGGIGGGFTYTINKNPGIVKDLQFFTRGSGYQVSDTLSLPTGLSGVSTIIPGEKTGVSTTLDIANSQITISSTLGIVAGMQVTGDQIDVGQLAPGTTVVSIDSSTTLTLSANPAASGSATLAFRSSFLNQLTVPDTTGVSAGDIIEVSSGAGILDGVTTVTSIVDATTLEFAPLSSLAGDAVINIIPPFGIGTSLFEFVINTLGPVSSVTVNNPGNGYSVSDVLTVSPEDLSSPISLSVKSETFYQINFDVGSQPLVGSIVVGDDVEDPNSAQSLPTEVISVNTSGGNITSIVTGTNIFTAGGDLIKSGAPGNVYIVDTIDNLGFRFFINDILTPDLTFYVGNTYVFDLSDPSVSLHPLALSIFPDGIWNKVENVSATLDSSSTTVTLPSTSGIIVGMEVTVTSGIGQLSPGTLVDSINGTDIVLSKNPQVSGAVVLQFAGIEYLESVTRSTTELTVKITSNTTNLYYYCPNHENMGGSDGNEATITIDQNNPRVFGSGFELSILDILSQDVIVSNSNTGNITSTSINAQQAEFETATATTSFSCDNILGDSIRLSTIVSTTGLTVDTTAQSLFNGNLSIGGSTLITTSGDISTPGSIRSNTSFNSNGKLLIEENVIRSTSGNDVIITPFSSQLAKVNTDTGFVIPTGTTLQRPGGQKAVNGTIRFNTDTNQYEGYNQTTSSWSSLGGVRDIDGNTYILAELTAGANDNTLWFYNDNVNTLRLNTQFLDFRSVKKISSGRLGLPAFTLWAANTPVTTGQYLKYRNNLYEVTAGGTTATVGNEPVHTSGIANNGTAQLTWHSLSVSPLEFTEIQELRVGPNKDCPLIVSAELKLLNNTISTLVEDLVLSPNSGKKVSVNATSSLVIPVGNSNQRGSAAPGSIRYNTTISQFEGYSGSNWSSLGGVRDVDGNTYIIPETTPGANENILYFYNNNVNTIKLSETELDFTNIDTITTTGGNSLALNTEILTLNSSDTTIDNTDASSTFISTTKQYLDLGLSSGLNVDPVLRLDDQGDVYLNVGFGTGTFNGVKIFDGDLKDFELADYAIQTNTFSLTKGSVNSSSSVLYSPANAKGCKVTVVSKSSSGKKSMAEYSVIDNGTDIFFTEIGSLNTSAEGFSAAFDFTPGNETRITLTLSNDHTAGDVVQFTVLTQTIK
jgi:hypothetical protein